MKSNAKRITSVTRWALALAAAACGAALGQDPPPANPLDAIRAKSALDDAEIQKVREQVAAHVQAIVNGELRRLSAFREDARGSARFEQVFVAATVSAVRAHYKDATPTAAAQLISFVGTLDSAEAQPLLVEALRSESPPVRTAAAVGLRDLRRTLAVAGEQFFSGTVSALRDAAQRESSPVALDTLYQALNFPAVATAPDPKALAQAVLAVLEDRGKQYARGAAPAENADAAGVTLAGALLKEYGDVEKARLLEAVGYMLRYAVFRYANELRDVQDRTASAVQIELRNRAEMMIMTAERGLAAVAGGQGLPSVTKVMQSGADATALKLEWDKWAQLLAGKTGGKDFSLTGLQPKDE